MNNLKWGRLLVLMAIGGSIAGIGGCTANKPLGVLTVSKPSKAASSAAQRPSSSPAASASPAGHADGDDHPHDEETAASSAGSAEVVSFKRDVVPVLETHCASCHSPGGSAPDHAMWFDADGAPDHPTIKDHAGVMIRYIKEGKMPLGKPNSLTAEEIELLEHWRAAGSQNN